MDKNKGVKIPVQVCVNMWLGLSAHEKKLNSFAQGTFSVFAEMVNYLQYTKIPKMYRDNILQFGLYWLDLNTVIDLLSY